ncbi:DUF4817 domain-containing protein [Trichonephila clavipes]|nr:DUF4817 domain-containing protein [Trichonephila clavipes]
MPTKWHPLMVIDTLTKSFPKALQNIPPGAVLILSDEVHFHLLGIVHIVNKQNFCYWTAENPQLLHQRPRPSVTDWCVIAEFGERGP